MTDVELVELALVAAVPLVAAVVSPTLLVESLGTLVDIAVVEPVIAVAVVTVVVDAVAVVVVDIVGAIVVVVVIINVPLRFAAVTSPRPTAASLGDMLATAPTSASASSGAKSFAPSAGMMSASETTTSVARLRVADAVLTTLTRSAAMLRRASARHQLPMRRRAPEQTRDAAAQARAIDSVAGLGQRHGLRRRASVERRLRARPQRTSTSGEKVAVAMSSGAPAQSSDSRNEQRSPYQPTSQRHERAQQRPRTPHTPPHCAAPATQTPNALHESLRPTPPISDERARHASARATSAPDRARVAVVARRARL